MYRISNSIEFQCIISQFVGNYAYHLTIEIIVENRALTGTKIGNFAGLKPVDCHIPILSMCLCNIRVEYQNCIQLKISLAYVRKWD